MNILAGAKTDLRFDPADTDFKPQSEVEDGPVFTVQTLDYFTAQGVLDEDKDADKIRVCIAAGLVAIDGDAARAKEFIAAPKATLVNPLFDAIWQATWGNSEAPEASE